VLAYRAIAIWVPAPVGLAALSALRRTIASWGREEAPAPVPVVARPEGRATWRPSSVHAAA
jgi:hypothetical protein